jgi:hypothetical protein
MSLLDWLTDGLGSSIGSGAGQGETGMGAGGMTALTPPTSQPRVNLRRICFSPVCISQTHA